MCCGSGSVCFLASWIRIRMFFVLLDPDPYPLVRCIDSDPAPDPDTSIIKQK
jgi:hypothetical protein